MAASLSPELRVMIAPARAYRELRRREERLAASRWLLRPLLVALVIGTAVALAATGRASAGLVVSSAVCWSVVPGVQALALRAAIGHPTPAIGFGRAVSLFFLGHAPWSLWLLVVALAIVLTHPEASGGAPIGARLLATAVAPALWTAWIVFCFFREVLALPARRAAQKTACYELIVWGAAFAYGSYATQLWTRVG